MRFLIVGYGRVGLRTAQILASEGHEVTIVDEDPEKVAEATDDGFQAHEGDGQDDRLLEKAGIADVDAIAALTGDLNANFAACMAGEAHDIRTVMRIDEDYREEIYEKYAADVDEIVYPERLGAAGAKTALLGGDLNVLADLTESLTAATVDVPPESPLVGRRVVGVELPAGSRIYAHGRVNEPLNIPLPQATIEAGDRLAVIADGDSLAAVRAMVQGDDPDGDAEASA
ncbi:potassium channel family protein [Haloglomus litoreum]|uniref:potassium channel family protein n=1 Tax=Haloglomus litoreum TaxID=3034026 RepID=UPI0023E7A22D|nr:TrkA family potassium uptake protein [Haloglomus sp. DT116]